jgi:hypothetical protein
MSTATPTDLVGPMTALQNRWYHGLTSGLARSPQSFQIAAPAIAIGPADASLWAQDDLLPPPSLTFDRSRGGADTLFAEYAAMASQLDFPQADFAGDIGADNYAAWTKYLRTVKPPPTANQLPSVFQRWAMVYAPAVAAVGAADLTQMAWIADAQAALAPYQGPDARLPDFAPTYAVLVATLAACPGGRVSFDSATTSGDVRDTWTGGADAGVQGLWAGAAPVSRLALTFARRRVTVSADLAHWTVSVPAPGRWYDSSILNLALSSSAAPPWSQDPDPTWEELFGATGALRWIAGALVVADGLQATITSDARYRPSDQRLVLANAARGLWPFYLADDGGDTVATTVRFDAQGRLTATVTTAPGVPLVLGADVLAVERYLGHAT